MEPACKGQYIGPTKFVLYNLDYAAGKQFHDVN